MLFHRTKLQEAHFFRGGRNEVFFFIEHTFIFYNINNKKEGVTGNDKTKERLFYYRTEINCGYMAKDILLKRFEIARKLYNTTLSYATKQYTLMKEAKSYRKQLRCYQKAKSKSSKRIERNRKRIR